MNLIIDKPQRVFKGEPLSEDDKAILSWGREAVKDSPKNIAESAKHLTTISAGLLSGALLLLKDFDPSVRAAILIALLAAFGLSLLAFRPRSSVFSLTWRHELVAARDSLIVRRSRLISAASACLFAAGLKAALQILLPN